MGNSALAITPGEYRTRDGRKAVVTEVVGHIPGVTGGYAVGHVPTEEGTLSTSWHLSGSYGYLGEPLPLDLMSPWTSPATITEAEKALDRAFERFVP